MENFNLTLILSALTVAVAGGYIIWGPSFRFKRRQKVPGLQNLGNTCFINAILQALAACPLVISWLNDIVQTCKADSFSLSTSLLSILKDLNVNSGLCSPTTVMDALRQLRWVISNEEQDAHELFHALTTTLEEELMQARPQLMSLLDIPRLQESQTNIENMFKKLRSDTIPSEVKQASLPFRGLLANQLTCTKCKHKYPVTYDTFDSVSLSIPTLHVGQLKLQDCIKKFISRESVSDVTCDKCAEAAKNDSNSDETESPILKTTFVKQLSFGKLPDCLCFHIRRTIWLSNGQPVKSYKHVAYPEVLGMDNYTYITLKKQGSEVTQLEAKLLGGAEKQETNSPLKAPFVPLSTDPLQIQNLEATGSKLLSQPGIIRKTHLYVLKAVVVHLGDTASGHFVTYRRGPVGKKWFRTSDSDTKEVDMEEVMQACAYMIFYEKLTSSKY